MIDISIYILLNWLKRGEKVFTKQFADILFANFWKSDSLYSFKVYLIHVNTGSVDHKSIAYKRTRSCE